MAANYYIDFTNGNDANDGLEANNAHAWQTINKFTSVTVRSAGDIAYVRANMTEILDTADLTFDEAGVDGNLIEIIGCDAVINDPWGDARSTKARLDFNYSAYHVVMNKNYWKISNFRFRRSNQGSTGTVYVTAKVWLEDVTIYSSAGALGIGVYFDGSVANMEGCDLENPDNNIYVTGSSILYLTNNTLGGGAGPEDYGIYATGGSNVFINDSATGTVTAFVVADIFANMGAEVWCRNCTFPNKFAGSMIAETGGIIHSEDDDGVYGAHITYCFNGTITKSSTARSGGAESSAQMMPNSSCGYYSPLCLNGESNLKPDFAIYNTSTSSVNVDIYIKADSAWGTYPTAAQLYTEASYLSNAASAARSTVVSDEVLSDGTTWVAFRTTFVPARAGFIYMKVYLKLYAATEGVLVDILPVVS